MGLRVDSVQPSHRLDSPFARWARRRLDALTAPAGITLDGPQPWDPRIHHDRALFRILLGGTLGAGESYMDGDWDCPRLDELATRLLVAGRDRTLEQRSAAALVDRALACVANLQTKARAKRDIRAHYDIGNELYAAMLGRSWTYSGAYWRNAVTLDAAQDAKHELICRKLDLQRGQRVLDIGCGWGGFAKYAATGYGVEVVGVTLSSAQAAQARRSCADLPVSILERDYRDVSGRFDHIVSIGMFEHVGPRNHRVFFERVRGLLAGDGLLLLHTIGVPESQRTTDPWVNRYIFPDGVLPSAAQITRAFEGLFVLEDWQSLGADYDRTLMAWYHNVEAAWSRLASHYSERFRRQWRYFLLTAAGAFRARRNLLWQLVLSPRGVAGGYRRPLV
jgi:cyclopropane-fatty-acyl-phospholipid synthase